MSHTGRKNLSPIPPMHASSVLGGGALSCLSVNETPAPDAPAGDYELVLRPVPDALSRPVAIRLRAVLKHALRACALRAVAIRPVVGDGEPDAPNPGLPGEDAPRGIVGGLRGILAGDDDGKTR
jgi:hypothetical protein